MRSTSIGCLSRKNKNYVAKHEELRREVSKGVNGTRRGMLTPLEVIIVGFVWMMLLLIAAYAVHEVADSIIGL